MNNGIQETSGYYGEHEEFETAKPIHEEPRPTPEEQCIECGKQMTSRCGCCGSPICSMHLETQAGFCSEFALHKFEKGETVEVVDGLNNLENDNIQFLEEQEINGCLMETRDPREPDLFFPMDNLPEDRDTPVSELDMDKVEVQNH
jgi:hypothetical protein